MNWANQVNGAMQWAYGTIRITFIWILFSFPYVVLYLGLLLADDVNSVGGTLGVAILLMPFIFVPSIVAMLGLCKRLLKSSSDFGQALANYWKRSEEHTSELQSRGHLVCRLLLEKKKKTKQRRESEKQRREEQ